MIITAVSRSNGGNEVILKGSEYKQYVVLTIADAKRLGFDKLEDEDFPVEYDDDETLEFLYSKLKAIRYCSYLLSFSDKSEKTLRQKLREKEYVPQVIDEALTVLRENGIISDEVLCRRKYRAIAAEKLYGPYRIKSELMSKGFSSLDIENASQECDIDFDSLLDELIEKLLRSGRIELSDTATLVKFKAKLSRYGYSFEQINSRIKAYSENIDE